MSRSVTRATIDDAVPHIYTREQADAIIDGYPSHERDARAKGIPILGSGRIFPLPDEAIQYDPAIQKFPRHFVWIGGCDFGWDHPSAFVKCCFDRDTGAFYVTQAYKRKEQTPVVHAAAVRPWGTWLPWAWPHDGLQHDKQSGKELSAAYHKQGLRMLEDKATFEDGGTGVEAAVMGMLDAMQLGLFKVAHHLHEWFDEFRLYHRKNGQVVKEFDDLLSATRYAWMMRRFAMYEGGKAIKSARPRAGGSWMT